VEINPRLHIHELLADISVTKNVKATREARMWVSVTIPPQRCKLAKVNFVAERDPKSQIDKKNFAAFHAFRFRLNEEKSRKKENFLA
jgi:hypothetical protein